MAPAWGAGVCAGRGGSTQALSASPCTLATEAPSACSGHLARPELPGGPVTRLHVPVDRQALCPAVDPTITKSLGYHSEDLGVQWCPRPPVHAQPARPPPGPGLSPGQRVASRRKVEGEGGSGPAGASQGPCCFSGNHSSPGPAPVLSGQWEACMWGLSGSEPASGLFPRTSPRGVF